MRQKKRAAKVGARFLSYHDEYCLVRAIQDAGPDVISDGYFPPFNSSCSFSNSSHFPAAASEACFGQVPGS